MTGTAIMCWTCMELYYVQHGEMPPIGYLLKQDGTETAVSVWFGYAICRVHSLAQLEAMHERREIGPGSEEVV